MRTRTRTESTNGDMLDFSWDDTSVEANTSSTQQRDSFSQDDPLQESSAPEELIDQQSQQDTASVNDPLESMHSEEIQEASSEGVVDTALSDPLAEEVVSPANQVNIDPLAANAPGASHAANTRQLDITQEPKTIAELLILLQTQAGLSNKEICMRFHITQLFLENLQKRQYSQILENNMGFHDLQQNVLYILQKLKADDTQMEMARSMLVKELKQDNVPYAEDYAQRTTTLVTDYGDIDSMTRRSSILTFLPQVVIIAVIVILFVTIIFSQLLPRLGGRSVAPKMNFAPLIHPVQPPPRKLPVPR